MSEFISVPRAMVENHLHEAVYAEDAYVYGQTSEPYLRAVWCTYNFDTFKFHALYELQPESYLDRILRRKHYKLVYTHNSILGSQGAIPSNANITVTKVKEFASLALEVSYANYRAWNT